ncbi:FAD synthetase family protein [Neobacillus novalis]|uniref:FAD synthase n=1 Tax=Neobacillus novalis TaxID=220687 RepID=A0AA95SAT3_9BACI|nr:FAD synthetase family protein [Neobacillus novalis]WHY85769.1 FAD synthetase family protein [Neobacillus novalis]
MKVHQTDSLTLSGSVVAIGAFDGVHRGHQAVLREMVRTSQSAGVPSVVYTFNPPPRAYFQGAQVLTKPEKKIQLIKSLGVSHIVLAEFNEKYLQRTAADFIKELSQMKPNKVIVGDDFRFGNRRSGDVSLLKEHFPVQLINPICCTEGKRISSTRIRELLIQGKQEQAVPLLGWT